MRDIDEILNGYIEDLNEAYIGFYDEDEDEEYNIGVYLERCLDFKFIINSDFTYHGVEVVVAFGGPSVWINTSEERIYIAWWNQSAKAHLSSGICEAIDDYFNELYCCRKWG